MGLEGTKTGKQNLIIAIQSLRYLLNFKLLKNIHLNQSLISIINKGDTAYFRSNEVDTNLRVNGSMP